MLSKGAAKKRRKELRLAAQAALAGMPDADLTNLLHEIGREMQALSNQKSEIGARFDLVKREIEKRHTATPSGMHITDHALVRYMERVKGIDMLAMRAEIGEIAMRARNERSGRHGVRRDESTGLVVGIDETRPQGHVTTIISERELTVMNV